MTTPPWTVRDSTYPLLDRWIRVRADDCATAAGVRVAPYYVLEFPDFVHVLAETVSGQIVLVRQYRHGIGASSLELPGGVMDPGESDILVTAAREGAGDDLRVQVEFTDVGIKWLALVVAKLTVIE